MSRILLGVFFVLFTAASAACGLFDDEFTLTGVMERREAGSPRGACWVLVRENTIWQVVPWPQDALEVGRDVTVRVRWRRHGDNILTPCPGALVVRLGA